jgi:hypothetical protein
MQNIKIDITSTLLEKSWYDAKSFLGKLIMPTIEETGLLLKDQVVIWRFKNQVKMLNKAKLYCEKNNISTKTISLKLLCPLLDYSGLEEDEVLQDKWAILLSNMVDSDQNIENHVFPYILSQLSSNEFLVLEKVCDEKLEWDKELQSELYDLKEYQKELDLRTLAEIHEKMRQIKMQLERNKRDEIYLNYPYNKETARIEYQKMIEKIEHKLKKQINEPPIFFRNLKDFEFSNLIRLGVIKEEKEVDVETETQGISIDRDYPSVYPIVEVTVDLHAYYVVTELGELFVNACKIKQNKSYL